MKDIVGMFPSMNSGHAKLLPLGPQRELVLSGIVVNPTDKSVLVQVSEQTGIAPALTAELLPGELPSEAIARTAAENLAMVAGIDEWQMLTDVHDIDKDGAYRVVYFMHEQRPDELALPPDFHWLEVDVLCQAIVTDQDGYCPALMRWPEVLPDLFRSNPA